ncbi:MAG TPA: tetratricopeptide repeat protein [Kofleriaceae bacterium]|nr:tetratricopeptide repeat protein [Kofleriaceae bacterium]
MAVTLSFMIAAFAAIAAITLEADADSAPPGRSNRREADAVRKDAGEALSRGEFARARALYEQVSHLDRADARAVREAGRAALAQGDLAYAVDALTRADALADHAPDPELHYLCGEALYALGRLDEGRREHVLVERDLGAAPPTRQAQLWLARVYARRGELARAELCYRWLTPAGQPLDVEVALHHAESDLLARDFGGAERVLHELLAQVPDHRRARELLAAALEGSGDLDGEIAVREDLARGEAASRSVFDYGRALERAGDWAGALRAYRRASALAGGPERTDPELAGALGRMTGRTSVEAAASVEARSDPQATALGEQIGIAVPFGSAHHIALGAWRERLTARDTPAAGWAGELAAAMALHGRRADAIAGAKLGVRELRAEDGSPDRGASLSGFADLRGRPSQHLELALDTEVNALWRETPRTLLDGGRTTGAAVHAYGIALGNRLIIDSGAQGRSLVLPGLVGGPDPTASQLLGWTGFDAVLWVDYAHPLHGEILDEDMRWPAHLAGAVVAGYRHFELWSDAQPEFTRRIAIGSRASIDEATLTARKVFAGGRLGVELRSLLGWDHAREVAISRIGGSLLATATRSSRISVSLDLGVESPTGFQGQTRTGWVSYHADL